MPAADSPDTVSYLRTLPDTECFELLEVAIVGRIGFVSPAGLQIIPMNYRLGVPPVPWAGSGSFLPVRFVPRTVSGRGLHRTRPD